MNKKVYETENFLVLIPELPHISREEGGHIFIDPKTSVVDRTKLSPKLAIELMRLTMVLGEAMVVGLSKQGIDIGRINYQDNGNWDLFKEKGPSLHIHLYGRAKTATIQKYGEACIFPNQDSDFYNSFEPLNDEDIAEIKKEIEIIFKQEKYQNKNWGL